MDKLRYVTKYHYFVFYEMKFSNKFRDKVFDVGFFLFVHSHIYVKT